MRAYICDSCGEVIADPYVARMKEFSLLFDGEENGYHKVKRMKVHLCEDCFESLCDIAKNKEEEG